MALDEHGIDWEAVEELEVTPEERRAILRSPISGGILTTKTIKAWRANAWRREIVREATRLGFERAAREDISEGEAFDEEIERLYAEHRKKTETFH